MKYLLPLLLLSFVTLASCEKKKCYQCIEREYHSNRGPNPIDIDTAQVCDMTEDDKEAYEKNRTITGTSTSGGTPITITKVTLCN